ncbi:MAG: hypothetical protein HYU66_29755, partial [Armatimonadetes bacterium]|nr:hypothetical protein [Armatimonadota bacterium]
EVRLEWSAVPLLEQVTVFAEPAEDHQSADFHVRVTVLNDTGTESAAVLRAALPDTGDAGALPLHLPSGQSRHELVFEVAAPRLWWPRGHGEPELYTVDVTLEADGAQQTTTRRTGVRRVTIDQSPHPVEGRYFTLQVNCRPIFCKGGNWVPPDLLYSTVDRGRYRELVELAVGANFNMLRVWGGGSFADHRLLEACDEAGVMVWHDFLFACSKYPGDDPQFAAEVRREVAHAVRDLAHHPSLVVWCGNNEIEWGDWEWGYDAGGRTHPHYAIFHHDIPQLVAREDPSTAHWLSSPHSPGFAHPNDPTVGDQHPWQVSLTEPGGADFWQYRGFVDRFPNEGGVLGMTSPATLRQFLPEDERYLRSPSWEHHDNPFAQTDHAPGAVGHAYSTVELWTGRDPLAMDWAEYAFVSALLQAEGLGEYISNYRRRMHSSASAIFWMYNDSWPVTHGWTIVDYYRRRKLAYHPVRRAFAPVTVVVAAEGDSVTVYGINETGEEWRGELRHGIFSLAGGLPLDRTDAVVLPPNASTPLAAFERSAWAVAGTRESGAFAVLQQGGAEVARHRRFVERFGDLHFIRPKIDVQFEGGRLTLRSEVFAWGVCLDLDGEMALPDNCFDLLPGVPYTLPWDDELGPPRVIKTGNRDAVPGER